MMSKQYDVVIVGAGVAGLKAASVLAKYDLKIAIIDENPSLGGQYLRTLPENFKDRLLKFKTAVKKEGLKLIEGLKNSNVEIIKNSTVIGVYEGDKILFDKEGRSDLIYYKKLIISTGVREKYFPFLGWDLPGVFSLGAVQVFLKSNGVLPAEEIVLAGTGPFLYAVAYEILKAGGKVKGIYELKKFKDQIVFSKGLLNFPAKLVEAFVYLEEILSNNVPIKYGWGVLKAEGDDSVERVFVGKMGQDGRVIEKSVKSIETELLAIGFGFVPNLEIARSAGINIVYNEALGGWVVETDDKLITSNENIYASGEITGVGGAEKSQIEGELSALVLLDSLNLLDNSGKSKIQKLVKKRKKAIKYSKYFNTVFSVPLEFYKNIEDNTVICRCENISMKKIKEAIEVGPSDMNFIKTFTRAGMGNCQGRTCGPIIENIIKSLEGKTPKPATMRKPIKPTLIGNLKKFYEERIKSS